MDQLPSTHYHSPIVQQYNREARDRGLTIDLSLENLIATAHQETGLERFGDESFRPALETFLQSAETEADLNPFGRLNARMRVLRSLKNRLWAEDCFAAAPEIRERKIEAPLIIVGPHRSGTTRLQHLLATDTRFQHLTTWEGMNPAPRRALPDQGRALRHEEVGTMLAGLEAAYPGASLAHPMKADWPEEEMLLLNHSFSGFAFIGAYHLPSYYRWFRDTDKEFAYRHMADLMKLISWSRGTAGNKPWILKNPQHMLDMDILLRVFPDARLVFTHRDPIKTVGSIMSLVWHFAVQHTDLPCRARTREVWMDFCEEMARRCMKVRESIPADQQIDIHYEDMNRDWRGQMKRIYDFAGMEFTPAAEAAQTAWLADSKGRHGSHRYSLEDFGTSAAEVDERMMFVREKYGIPYEDR
ncbi:MAG TPA: sulfotransferase [Rhodocyclaceae bacterium]|nr:sulfotransferase [Rhodocyclaceae bacterium]